MLRKLKPSKKWPWMNQSKRKNQLLLKNLNHFSKLTVKYASLQKMIKKSTKYFIVMAVTPVSIKSVMAFLNKKPMKSSSWISFIVMYAIMPLQINQRTLTKRLEIELASKIKENPHKNLKRNKRSRLVKFVVNLTFQWNS